MACRAGSGGYFPIDAQRLDETRGAIVGRDSELAKLADAWSEAKIGKGKVVLLMGDPGLGKSRLAKAGLDLASRDGGTTLEIDCMPSMGNSPLYPVGVLLRRMANIHHTANEAETLDCAKRLLAQFFAEDERQDALEYLSPSSACRGPRIRAVTRRGGQEADYSSDRAGSQQVRKASSPAIL